jgi:hypothetical protein
VGFEPTTNSRVSLGKAQKRTASSSKSGSSDADLQRVADAWPTLSGEIRAAIMALVRAGSISSDSAAAAPQTTRDTSEPSETHQRSRRGRNRVE